MDTKFSIKSSVLKNIVLFSPEVNPEDNAGADGSISLKLENNKLNIKISSFRYVLTGIEDIDTNEKANFILPLKKLQDIVKLVDGEKELNFKIKESDVEIRADGVKYKLRTIEEDEVEVTEKETGAEYIVDKKTFLDGFKKVKIAMGDDEVRYYLNGINTEILQNKDGENDLFFVATNGHLLGTFGEKKEGYEIKEKGIVPKKVVPEVIKLLEIADDNVTISVVNNKMLIKTEKLEMLLKLIEATFPDYNKVIPSANDKSFTVNIASLKTTLQKILIISNAEKTKDVLFFSKEKSLTLENKNSEGQSALSEIPLLDTFDEVQTNLDAKYILEIIAQFEEENLLLKFSDGNSPLIAVQKEAKNILFVLMPIRM